MSTYSFDDWERMQGRRPKKKDDCFIATACYNNVDSPEIVILRKWRDGVLSKRIAGRAFIRIYYRVGPFLARRLQKHPALLSLVRRGLDRHVSHISNQVC